jgi:glycine/D-amino acid oxidase-like deaminating enzyme
MLTKSVALENPQVTSVKDAQAAMSAPVLSLWPYKFVTQLLGRLVEEEALNLQTNTPVEAVHLHNDHSTTALTPRGSIHAKHVIFATNAYSAGLLPQYRGTIIPIKALGTHISVPTKEGRTQPPPPPYLSNTYNMGFGGGRDDWLNPRPDGSIVVGGGKWLYKDDKRGWHNSVDDSTLISPAVNHYYDGYMQRHFHGWEDSGAYVDARWTGSMFPNPLTFFVLSYLVFQTIHSAFPWFFFSRLSPPALH